MEDQSTTLKPNRDLSAFTSRHDAVGIGQPKELNATLNDVLLRLLKDVREDLNSQIRLAEYNEHPRRLTAIHIAVQIIDEGATTNTILSLQEHDANRFEQVIRWVSKSFTEWKLRYRAMDN